MAIMARWRMPPENWWGYLYPDREVLREGMPVPAEHNSMAAALPILDSFSPSKASYIWLRMRSTGLRAVMGSWKIAISLPRIFAAPRWLILAMSAPLPADFAAGDPAGCFNPGPGWSGGSGSCRSPTRPPGRRSPPGRPGRRRRPRRGRSPACWGRPRGGH